MLKKRATNKVAVQIRPEQWLKDEIARLAKKEGVSQNTWILNQLWRAVQEERSLPIPPQAVARIPTPADLLMGHALGQPPLEPCGVPAPCAREGVFQIGEFSFCETCRIRVE